MVNLVDDSFETSLCPKDVQTLVFNSFTRRYCQQHEIFGGIIIMWNIVTDMMLYHVAYCSLSNIVTKFCRKINISANKLSFTIWILSLVTMYIQIILFIYNNIKYSHKTKTIDTDDVVSVILLTQLFLQCILDMIILIKIIVWMYFVSNTAYPIVYDACLITFPISNGMIHSGVFCKMFGMVQFGNSHIDYFMCIYTICIHIAIIHTIYIYFQAIITSIIKIYSQLLNIYFINCIVIMIAIGLNNYNDDCKSYYKSIYGCCSSFIQSIMIYLATTSLRSIICVIFQWIKQYCNNLNDKFDGYQLENNQKCESYGYMDCVTIDVIVMCIMSIVYIIYFIYAFIDGLPFQEMILVH